MRSVLRIIVTLLFVILAASVYWLANDLNSVPGRTIRSFFVSYPHIDVPFGRLSPTMRANDLVAAYPTAKFACYAEDPRISLGDYVCAADADVINGVSSAMIVAFFYLKGELNQVRVSYRGYRHDDVLSWLRQQFGPSIQTNQRGIHGERMLMWMLNNGTIAASENIGMLQDSVVLWSSKEAILRSAITNRPKQ